MPFVARMEYLDLLDVWADGRAGIAAWWTRAKARSSFAKAISSRLRPEEVEAMKTFGGALKERIRERRAEYLRSIA